MMKRSFNGFCFEAMLDFGLVGRFDDRGDDFADAFDFLDQIVGLAFGKNVSVAREPKPVVGFTSLLCRDAHL